MEQRVISMWQPNTAELAEAMDALIGRRIWQESEERIIGIVSFQVLPDGSGLSAVIVVRTEK